MDSAVFNNIKKYITENKIVNAQVFWLKIKLDRQYEFEQYILKNPKNKKQIEDFIRTQRDIKNLSANKTRIPGKISKNFYHKMLKYAFKILEFPRIF